MIDSIIAFNKEFVASKGYEKYLTDKYPDKKLAVLSCMDTRLTELLPLGVNEEMVVAHSHCGACHMSYSHFHEQMLARGVTDETLDTIRRCGIDLNQWLEGFRDTPDSVRRTVETISTHPLVPRDIVVRGFIIDSETGALEEVV